MDEGILRNFIPSHGFPMMENPGSVQVFSDKYLENIGDAFKTLYNEEQLSDVTIYCKEGSLKAHKLILAASSPYFCKVFRETKNEFPILILHGTSLNQMKNLIDLVYSGITDVNNNDLEALLTLVREFEIKGVSFGSKISANNVRLEVNSSNVSPEGIHNRETRFKGQKRVAVDYVHDDSSQTHLPSTSRADQNETRLPKRANLEITRMEEPNDVKREISSPAPTEDSSILSSSDITSMSDRSLHIVHTESKMTAWAKKQRKFKCDLCPSSFKRSSHLSRHQLVHTGERPYSCDRCEKSFSRHDKLKNHIRKAHEYIPDSMYEKIDNDNMDSDAESNNINYRSPNHTGSENGLQIEHSRPSSPKNSPPLFTISHITSILEDSFVNPPKKSRGRPRKYPPPTASPAALNSNQELPVSNDIKEKEEIPVSRRLRERTNVNNNEDLMFSRIIEERRSEQEKRLFCEICDKPFRYPGRLKLHMKKIHGVKDNIQVEKSNNSNVQEAKIEGKAMEKVNTLETTNSNDNEENLTYAQLRELLPKECTLQLIAGGAAPITSQNDSGQEESSELAGNKICDSDQSNSPQGPQLFAISSLLQCETSTPIENTIETSNATKEIQAPKEFRSRRKKRRRGGIIYVKPKKTKPKQDQPMSKQPLMESNISPDSIVDHSVASIIENSSTLNMEGSTSQFKLAKLSPAIEISIVPSNEVDISTVLPKKKNSGADLSITVIDTLTETSQRDKMLTDCKLGNQFDHIRRQENDLIEGNNPYCNGVDPKPGTEPITQKKKRGRPRKPKLPIDEMLPTCYSENEVKFDLLHKPNNDLDEGKNPYFNCIDPEPSTEPITQKKKRGRPRKLPVVSPLIKKGRGRPKTNVYPAVPGIQNYNITNLPYGDFNYLTGQTSTRNDDEEEAAMMEPLVEINMDQTEQSIDAETTQNMRRVAEENKTEYSRMMDPIIIEPVVRIAEQSIKKECSDEDDSQGNIDISEIETKIGLIGECTISVAN